MEPAVAHRLGSPLGVVVVALHDDVAADGDLTQRLAVVRYLAAGLVHHPQLARTDQLDALARLDPGALRERQVPVLGARLAEGDEGRRFGEAVDLRQLPAEFALDQL